MMNNPDIIVDPVNLKKKQRSDRKFTTFHLHDSPGERKHSSWVNVSLKKDIDGVGKEKSAKTTPINVYELLNSCKIADRTGRNRAPDISLCIAITDTVERQTFGNVVAIWDCKHHDRNDEKNEITESEYLKFKEYMIRLLPPKVKSNDIVEKIMPGCFNVSSLITNGMPFNEVESELLKHGFSQAIGYENDYTSVSTSPTRDKHETSTVYSDTRNHYLK